MDEGQEADEQVSGPGPVFKKELKDMEEEEDAVEWNPNAYFREKYILYVNNFIKCVDSSYCMGQGTRVSIWGKKTKRNFSSQTITILSAPNPIVVRKTDGPSPVATSELKSPWSPMSHYFCHGWIMYTLTGSLHT